MLISEYASLFIYYFFIHFIDFIIIIFNYKLQVNITILITKYFVQRTLLYAFIVLFKSI